MKRPYGIFCFFAFCLILVLAGCGGEGNLDGQGNESPSTRPVRTLLPLRQDLADTLSIYGTVEFRRTFFLASQFAGRLDQFSLLAGDRVSDGAQVGSIIPPSREALLQVGKNLPPEVRDQLSAEVKAVPLVCPSDGVVLQVLHHSGDVLQPDEQIAHIGEDRVLQILADLPVRYLSALRPGQQVEVIFPGSTLASRTLPVATISAEVDAMKQTARVRLDLPNAAGDYHPGMLTRLSFPLALHPRALCIPRDALVEEEGLFSIFVVENGLLKKRMVATGIIAGNRVEITGGLGDNERLVAEKVYSLQDGMAVTVE